MLFELVVLNRRQEEGYGIFEHSEERAGSSNRR